MTLIAAQAFYSAAFANDDLSSSTNLAMISRPVTSGFSQPQTHIIEEASSQHKELWGVEINACHFGGDEAERLAKDGVLIGTDSKNNYLDLEAGNVLLTPEQDMVVGTSRGKIIVGSGASIFISQSDEDTIVYDLLQTKPKQVSVTVIANKQKVVLEPGRMLVLTKQSINDFEKVASDCHRLVYHNVKPLDVRNAELTAFVAEFSIASAFTAIEPLKELAISDHERDQSSEEKVLKGAVILGDHDGSVAASFEDVYSANADGADNTSNVKIAAGNNQH